MEILQFGTAENSISYLFAKLISCLNFASGSPIREECDL